MRVKYKTVVLSVLISAVSVFQGLAEKLPKYHNPTGNEFPVLAWYSIPDSAQNPERYRELREAGFNLSYSQLSDNSQVARALSAASESGVRLIAGSTQLESDTRSTVIRFRNNPALVGWFLKDEPKASEFSSLRDFRDRIYSADTTHLIYLNLLPDLLPPEDLEAESYGNYVERFIDEVSLPMVSYDFYPVVTVDGKTVVRGNFYDNLEKISRICREKGLPFWVFCLSTAHSVYPVPTDTHLRFEAFSALAYGAQALQYFTYWQPDTGIGDFHEAPINEKGERTAVYYRVRNLNREIYALSPVFLGMEVISVGHSGSEIPQGTRRFSRFPVEFSGVETDGEGLLISYFRNGADRYMMILNRSIDKSQNVRLRKQSKVRRVMPDGKVKKSRSSKERIAPGGYLLYTWR